MTAELHGRPWEMALDEAYWQALLQQGEDAPPVPEMSSGPDPWEYGFPEEEFVAEESFEVDFCYQDGLGEGRPHGVWDRLYELYESSAVVPVSVVGCNKGGLLIRIENCIGFVPASQLAHVPECLGTEELRNELRSLVGCKLHIKLIELDRSRNRIIGSERATAWQEDEIHSRLQSLQVGQVVRGYVRSLCEFGAFIDLGGIDGLLHISEMSWDHIDHPHDLLEVGQEIEVRVIHIDQAQRRIGLSLKRMQPDPWTLVGERYHVGDLVEAVITNVVDFGAFARVPEGVEGLIHISELAEGHFLHPRNVVEEGQRVRARILNVDPVNRRLGLSLRPL